MLVSLFVTCLVDQLWSNVGVSSVEVLRRVGCDVEFDDRQTCCSQPAFNTGYRDEARQVARRFISVFESSKAEAIVSPSGSCTAMVHHLPELFAGDDSWQKRAQAIAGRTYELSSFLVRVLNRDDVGASWNGRVTWHDACHGLRDLNIKSEPRKLISNVRGAEFVELENADSCCGFGGTFSVKYPDISGAILDSKLGKVLDTEAGAVLAGDLGCLMQIAGGLEREHARMDVRHVAEVLAGMTDTPGIGSTAKPR